MTKEKQTEPKDVVYFVKECKANEELRWSLRTVAANFPVRKVWFYGGRPKYLKPDEHVKVAQNQPTKWQNVAMMIRMVCENPEITDDWWLFNDDFFIMQPTGGIEAPYNGDLYRHIVDIENRHGMSATAYTRELRLTAQELERRGLPVLNYAIHMPMLINKEKALATLESFQDYPMFRSLYGNLNKIGGTDMKDCKCSTLARGYDEEAAFLSTEDAAFMRGKVGEFIRGRFPERSRYET